MNPKTCRGESEQALFKDPASSHSRSNNPLKRAFEPHITGIMYPSAGTHKCCEFRWSSQRFGEFVGWCHPSEGLSRAGVEGVGGLVEVVLGVLGEVGSFGKVLA